MRHPNDRDVDVKESRNFDRRKGHKKQEKHWRNKNNNKAHETYVVEELEEMTLRINKLYRCSDCHGVSSLHIELCSTCSHKNPHFVPHT